MGRNKDPSSSRAADHVSRPLSDLRDPSAFAPPPRRTASALGPPHPRTKPSSSPGQSPDPAQPGRPYWTDTTGLRTDHLPPPPGRGPATKPAPPSLPPRLPLRGAGDAPSSHSAPDRYLNQGAVANLGAAGGASPPPPRPTAVGTKSSGERLGSHVDGLQGKFSALGMPSDSSATPPPSQGSTLAQKQAALRTASAFHKNPSSVSLSDAKAAAGTANNFRQRHGDQVEAGVKRTHHLNQKYGVMDKVGAYADRGHQSQAGQATTECAGPSLPAKKKPPPPPPPKKKPGVGGSSQQAAAGSTDPGAPPPIPTTTRPAF